MGLGLGIVATGFPEAERKLASLGPLSEAAGAKALGAGAAEAHEILSRLLDMPKRRDPFWGVMGTDSPFGLALRSGITKSALIYPRMVFRAADGSQFTFIAHGAEHVRQLEEGGRVSGVHWIPTAAGQMPSGAERHDIPGAFVWPTAKMKNFKNGPPKHEWLVVSATGSKGAPARRTIASGRRALRRAGELPQGPMPGTPGGLIFLKMKKNGITTRGHHTFGKARELMIPVMERLAANMGAEVVRAA